MICGETFFAQKVIELVSAPPRNPFGASEWNARHCGGFDGQSDQILRFQIVDMRFSASTRNCLRLERQNGEVIRELTGSDDGI
jgi:hypothetical protein